MQSDVALSFESTRKGRDRPERAVHRVSRARGSRGTLPTCSGRPREPARSTKPQRIPRRFGKPFPSPALTGNPGIFLGGTDAAYDAGRAREPGPVSSHHRADRPREGRSPFRGDAEREDAKSRMREIAAAISREPPRASSSRPSPPAAGERGQPRDPGADRSGQPDLARPGRGDDPPHAVRGRQLHRRARIRRRRARREGNGEHGPAKAWTSTLWALAPPAPAVPSPAAPADAPREVPYSATASRDAGVGHRAAAPPDSDEPGAFRLRTARPAAACPARRRQDLDRSLLGTIAPSPTHQPAGNPSASQSVARARQSPSKTLFRRRRGSFGLWRSESDCFVIWKCSGSKSGRGDLPRPDDLAACVDVAPHQGPPGPGLLLIHSACGIRSVAKTMTLGSGPRCAP